FPMNRQNTASHWWMHGVILAACAFVIVDGIGQPFRYKLFPYAVVGVILVLSIAEWIRQPTEPRPEEPQAVQDEGTAVETTVTSSGAENAGAEYPPQVVRLFGWILALMSATVLIGIVPAAAVFILGFLVWE